jgi:hypothetical protein
LADDFEFVDGQTFGEWLRHRVNDDTIIERDGFFVEQVARIAVQLQQDHPPEDRLEVLIPWLWFATAFTAPGRYVYFSRRLLERCRHDDAVAFVIAHEIAHHDLGHMAFFRSRLARRVGSLGAGKLVVLYFRSIQKRLYSLGNETAADRRALWLCIQAGYHPRRCLELFDTLSNYFKDIGYIDAVYGPDEMSDQELHPDADFMTKARIWLWLRRHGYLPILDRAAELRRVLEEWEAHPNYPNVDSV